MQVDENDRESIGFLDLNGPDLSDTIGKRYGR
jgi:hypothetical protein